MNTEVIIVGTGLTQSILAAALCRVGYTVLHVDENAYYGGAESSLTWDELIEWTKSHSKSYSKVEINVNGQISRVQSRSYSISLSPVLIPSVSGFVDTLVHSGVSKYVSFKLIEATLTLEKGPSLRKVPGSKEDIFTDQSLSLLEKRKLMKFLQYAASQDASESIDDSVPTDQAIHDELITKFSLSKDSASAIAYAVALAASPFG